MTAAVSVHDVTKRYGKTTALDHVDVSVEENAITGLLGRNGAGKTTLMHIITGQGFTSSGRVQVFGERPHENDRVLSQVCFVKDNQRYPDSFKVRHVLGAARLLYPNWDQGYAESLLVDFQLPLTKKPKHLSRGMLSALGIVVGLASRAPLTIFDEPYLGLDAVARQLFYDRLLADYTEHPRTVVLSTHLIDEVSNLVEHVVVIDRGRILIDTDTDTLRGRAVTVTGPVSAVDEFTAGREELHREQLGSFARVTVDGTFGSSQRTLAQSWGLDLEPVSLQQLVVRTTTQRPGSAGSDHATAAMSRGAHR